MNQTQQRLLAANEVAEGFEEPASWLPHDKLIEFKNTRFDWCYVINERAGRAALSLNRTDGRLVVLGSLLQ